MDLFAISNFIKGVVMKKSLILLVLMPFLSIIINAQTNCPPTLNDPTWPQNSEMYGYE